MILEVKNVTKVFTGRGRTLFAPRTSFTALRDVNISVRRGESFGLVGESGSGKTTLTRCILGLESVTSGSIAFDGQDLLGLTSRQMRAIRARVQIVFQDPYASLNPRMTVHDIIAEPMAIHRELFSGGSRKRTERVMELLELVGLGSQHAFRYAHEFSGGQRQRVGIARALAVNPEMLILDEPTSALDVSVQAQVLNLLHELQTRLGLTYLFISHDLGVIKYICDRVALIYGGEIIEEGDVTQVFVHPQSEYARMLLTAMPEPDPDKSPFRKPSVRGAPANDHHPAKLASN